MPNSPINQGTATGAGTATTPGSIPQPTPFYDANGGVSDIQRLAAILKISDDAGVTFYEAIARDAVMLKARGLLAETYPYTNVVGVTAMVTGTVYYSAIPLLAGQVINSFATYIQAAGTSMTLAKIGLCDLNGNRLAITADQSTNWQSVGNKLAAALVPYVVPVSGMYYHAQFGTTGGTMPSLSRGSSGVGADGSAIGTGAKLFGSMTGQTDIPAAGVITSSLAVTQAMMWGAVSSQ
jgi:hypothetical protein